MPNNPYRPHNGKLTNGSEHNHQRINRQIITPNRGGGLRPNSNFEGSRSGGRR